MLIIFTALNKERNLPVGVIIEKLCAGPSKGHGVDGVVQSETQRAHLLHNN